MSPVRQYGSASLNAKPAPTDDVDSPTPITLELAAAEMAELDRDKAELLARMGYTQMSSRSAETPTVEAQPAYRNPAALAMDLETAEQIRQRISRESAEARDAVVICSPIR
jgi:hypothetical protein